MVHLEATSDLGEGIRVSGRTRAEAERNMIAAIERQSGMRFVAKHGEDVAEFAPPECFAELPAGNYDRICIRASDGQMVCHPRCTCPNPSSCSCTTNFSESNSMKISKRRRYAEGDAPMPRDEILDQLAEAGGNRSILEKCDDDALAEIAKLLLGDAESYIEGGTQGGGHSSDLDRDSFADRKRKGARKFSEKGFVSFAERSQIEKFCEDYNRSNPRRPQLDSELFKQGFAACKKVHPQMTFEDFLRP